MSDHVANVGNPNYRGEEANADRAFAANTKWSNSYQELASDEVCDFAGEYSEGTKLGKNVVGATRVIQEVERGKNP